MTAKKKNNEAQVKIKILTDDKIGALDRISNIFTSLGISIEKTVAYKCLFSRKFICKLTLRINNADALIGFFENNREIKQNIALLEKTEV
jgi:hypothetical protein